MLVAEKQLLDANLRNDLMMLRRLELKMMVNRFMNVIPAATLIAGFTFSGLVEMNLLATEDLNSSPLLMGAANVFHLFGAIALSTSCYAVSVSSIAIVLGQRLAVQATAQQTSKHSANMKELSNKFVCVLAALGVALTAVAGAAICTIWVRAAGAISIAATVVISLLLPFSIWSIWTMNSRINDSVPEPSTINLRTEEQTMNVSEFRVGDAASIPASGKRDIDAAARMMCGNGMPQTEQSALLTKCLPPCAA